MQQLRYVTRPCKRMRHRFEIYDTLTKQPYNREPYKSKRHCETACDRLNGNILAAADKYRTASRGE